MEDEEEEAPSATVSQRRRRPRGRRTRKTALWRRANELLIDEAASSTEAEPEEADASDTENVGSSATARPTNTNMNSYSTRQNPRIPNSTQKTGLAGGWGTATTAGAAAGVGVMQSSFGGLGAPGRPGQLSGFAQVMGGGGTQGPIDMSDFPSLSGGQSAQQNNASSVGGWNSSAIRQLPSQHPSQSQQRAASTAPSQQSTDQYDGQRSAQLSAERAGGADEFPPLGGQLNGGAVGQPNGFSDSLASPEMQPRQSSGQHAQLPIRQSSGAYHSSQQSVLGQSSQLQQPSGQSGPLPPPDVAVKKYSEMTESEKWGMPGLMAALEARRQAENGGQVDDTLPPSMRSAVIMGQELNDLGMNLDSPEPLYSTFIPFPAISSSGSAFDFHDRHVMPDFTLPAAYTVTNVPPLSSRMGVFSDETLFSVFYQMPRDIAQELAAQELTAREWRWHKVLRQWLQKDTRESNAGSSLPLVDLAGGAPIGAQPVRVGERSERGVYIFFDAMNWRRERREFVLDYDQLDHHRNPPAASAAAVGANTAAISGGVGMSTAAIGSVQQGLPVASA